MADQKQGLKQQLVQQKSSGLKTQNWTTDEKVAVAEAIGQVFDLQKQFGKNAGQLQTIIGGFCWALQRYSAERVLWALGEYILRKPDMPTPYDIRQIIDPIVEPIKFDKAYYIQLKKLREEQGPYALTQEEEDYCKAYEEAILAQRRSS
jgi:hypothetical protein